MHINMKNCIDEVNMVALNYKKKEIYDMKIENKILEYCYFYTITKIDDEENALLFSHYMKSKFKIILDSYNPHKGIFTIFFNSIIYTNYLLYIKGINTKEKTKQLSEIIKIQDVKNKVDEDFEYIYKEDFNQYFDSNIFLVNIKLTKNEIKGLLAFSLHYAFLLTEEMIKNISHNLKINELTFIQYVDQAKDSIQDRYEKIEKHRKLRNYYFLRFNMLAYKNISEPLNEEDLRIYKSCCKKHQSHIKMINSLLLVPYVNIAEIVDIDYEKIRSYIFYAKKKLKNILDNK